MELKIFGPKKDGYYFLLKKEDRADWVQIQLPKAREESVWTMGRSKQGLIATIVVNRGERVLIPCECFDDSENGGVYDGQSRITTLNGVKGKFGVYVIVQ